MGPRLLRGFPLAGRPAVAVHFFGHGSSPVRAFCECYIYTLNGPVRKCARQPKGGDDPEGRCGEITP